MKKAIILVTLLLAACGSTKTQMTSEIVMPEAPEILNRAPAPLKTIRSQYPEKTVVEPIQKDTSPESAINPVSPITPNG